MLLCWSFLGENRQVDTVTACFGEEGSVVYACAAKAAQSTISDLRVTERCSKEDTARGLHNRHIV